LSLLPHVATFAPFAELTKAANAFTTAGYSHHLIIEKICYENVIDKANLKLKCADKRGEKDAFLAGNMLAASKNYLERRQRGG
jgi:hypothetical protein